MEVKGKLVKSKLDVRIRNLKVRKKFGRNRQ